MAHIPGQARLHLYPDASHGKWTSTCSCGVVGTASYLPTLILGMGMHRQGQM